MAFRKWDAGIAMDPARFASLTRLLAATDSRNTALGALIAVPLERRAA